MPKIDIKEFIKRCRDKHGDKYDYSKTVYLSFSKKLVVNCRLCGHEWWVKAGAHMWGNGCPKCRITNLKQNQPISHEEFCRRSIIKHGDIFQFLSIYKGQFENITIQCKKCGYIFTKQARSHLNDGNKCLSCNGMRCVKLTKKTYIEKARKVHGNKYDYSKLNYIDSRTKVCIICKKCGRQHRIIANAHLMGGGCPRCKDSLGEKTIRKYLDKHFIKYESEKTFPSCKNIKLLRFDFYLPEYNCCIEYDGIYHFIPIKGTKALQKSKKRDSIKNKFCKKEKISLIRIHYLKYNQIAKILDRKLDELRNPCSTTKEQ